MYYLVWESHSHDNSDSPCMGVELFNTLEEAESQIPNYTKNDEYDLIWCFITDTIRPNTYESDWLAHNYGPMQRPRFW